MEIKVDKAIGLRITPVKSSGIEPFDIIGEVIYKDFEYDCRIYYCADRSFPEQIVEVLYE